jgi:hypothetical protein
MVANCMPYFMHIVYRILSDDQNWSWSYGLARLLLQDQDGTSLAKPRPRLGLQEQNQINTKTARPRSKQDHHCKTLAVLQIFFSLKTH